MNASKLGALAIIASGALSVTSTFVAESQTKPVLVRSVESENADGPSGRLILRVPAGDDGAATEQREPGIDAPSEPSDPSYQDEEAPTFFDEEVGGRIVFILDVSMSMHNVDSGAGGEDWDGNAVSSMSRLDKVKTETIRTLRSLSDEDSVEFVLLAGNEEGNTAAHRQMHPNNQPAWPYTDAWQGKLMELSGGMRDTAVEYVKELTLWWGTPTWRALERATHDYGDDVDTLILLSDGVPIPQYIRQGLHTQCILADFPGWFEPLAANGCRFACFHIGRAAYAGSFLQELAGQNGGSYRHID